MLGGAERGVGRLRICERTQMLLVEIRAVTPCCSPTAAMAAGCRPASPWGYQRFAGAYTFLEKRIVAELTPPRPRVVPPQDFTSHPSRLRPLPVEPHYGPPPERHPPGGPLCAPLTAARPGPPSYETHMRRARAAHLRRGGPPPYVSPPAYNAPHRTLRPPPAQRPRSPLPKPRGRGAVPGGCSHTLPRAATEGGSRWLRGMQPPPGITEPPRHCQTLPRTAAPRHRPVGPNGGRRGSGGHVLIDATRVVVRAQYVPPPQRHHVRYAGGVSVPATPPGTPPAPHGASTPPSALSPPRGSEQSPGKGGGSRGRPPPRRPALYSQALREAVSRIRRHTAPDSDSDAEGGAGGGRQRPCRDVSAYSSSSSLESLGGAPPGTASPIRA
ncbi:dendrin isoform X2 [Gallus gallus]|uniref:dendrin isoform X2 n=1 Tax=Gallus gallus TaxID=9031 RepID=UPI000D63F2B5|nr:dendrin isoform X2 [Gallus gallus]|eukprot:XP_015129302.2 dendrin-like [Gallus gallus]